MSTKTRKGIVRSDRARILELLDFVRSGRRYGELPNYSPYGDVAHESEINKYRKAQVRAMDEEPEVRNLVFDTEEINSYFHIYVKRLGLNGGSYIQ